MGEAVCVARYQQCLDTSSSRQPTSSIPARRILHAFHLGGHCAALHLALVTHRGTSYAADLGRAGRAVGDAQFFNLNNEVNITLALEECPLVCEELDKFTKPGASLGIPEFLVLAGNQNFTLMPLSVMPKEGYPASSAKIVCDTLLQRMDTAPPIRYDAIANLDEFKWSQCFGSAGMTLPAHKDWMQMALKQLLLTGTVMYWLLTEKRFQEALTLYDTMCSFVNSGGVITELPAPDAQAQHQQLMWLRQNPERASQLLLCTLATQPPPADLQPNQQLDLQLVASALAAETNMIAAAATNKNVQDASDLMEALEIMTGTQTVAV